MSKTRRGLSFLLCLVMAFSLFAGVPFKVLDTEANAADTNTNPGNNSEWVTAWHTSMLYLDADSDVQRAVTALSNYNERTFRTVIPMTIVGNTVRLTYSNEYATAENGEELKIGEITLAKGDPSDTARWADTKYVAVTDMAEVFKTAIAQGKAYMGGSYYQDSGILHVKPGQIVVSEPIDISSLGLNAMDYMAVSTWICDMNSNITGFKKGFTGGLIGGKTNYLGLAVGGNGYNHTESRDLDDVGLVSSVALSSSNATGDYNVIPFLSTVEVQRSTVKGVDDRSNAYTTVIFGDSTVANDIPVYLAQTLKSSNINGVAVTWAAVKGNEVLLNGQDGANDSNGNIMDEAAISVVDEVKTLEGVKKVILKVGINDILHPQCSDMSSNFASRSDDEIAQQIIAGYKYIVEQLHDKGIEVYFYELTPWRADDGTYYSRNSTISAWTGRVDNIRLKVNAWLAKYGADYDTFVTDRKTGSGDGYEGNITLGNQYGTNGYTKAYKTKEVTVSQDKFDRFGYISLESLGSTSASVAPSTVNPFGEDFTGMTAMKKAYTTDGIHFTAAGQSKVAKSTPISIFYDRKDNYAGAGSEVNVYGIYFATTELVVDHNYFICNTDASSIKDKATENNQSIVGYIAGNPGVVSGDDSTGKNSDLESNAVTVQRGTQGRPYIVRKSVADKNEWTLVYSDSKDSYYWTNNGMFLAWYYPGAQLGYGDYFKTGVRDSRPYHTGAKGWFTFDRITASSADGDYTVRLWYDPILFAEKTLVYNNGKFITSKNSNKVALYDNSSKGVKINLDIDNNEGLLDAGKDKSDNTVLTAAKANTTTQLNFHLYSERLDSNGNPDGMTFHNAPKNNDARGPYDQYVFGDNQKIFWMSTNTDVAEITQSAGTDNKASYTYGGGNVKFTGNGGTTMLVANFFWQEADGEKYEFDNKVVNGTAEYYTTAEKDAAIANGSKVPSTTENGYHWVEVTNGKWVWTNYHWLTSTTTVTNINKYACDITLGGLKNNTGVEDQFLFNETPTGKDCLLTAENTSDPADAELPGTGWKWVSSDTSVAEVEGADESANLIYKSTGTTTITLTRVDENSNAVNGIDGNPITSSIIIHVNEIPTIDIEFNGSTLDDYTLPGVTAGDNFPIKAFINNKSNATITSWKWSVLDDKLQPIKTFTVTPANAQSAKLVVNEAGAAYILVEANYTLPNNGGSDVVRSSIRINAEYSIQTETNTIIDFGLPVKLDLGAHGISKDAPKNTELVKGRSSTDEFAADAVTLGFGVASLEKGSVIYTPKQIANDKDTIYYSADVGNGYKYSNVNIIPASSIYYEDSFVTYNGTGWKVEGEAKTGVYQDIKDDVYGYDAAYGQYTTYSNGSAHYVTVNNEYGANFPTYTGEYPTASFTFTGTGFAVYSTSDNDAGYVSVKYKNETTGATKKFMVNSFANGDYDQTPTVQVLDLPYGTYTVTLTVVFDKSFDGNNDGHYTYCLDAVRIYEPLKGNVDANNAYAEVGEANAQYKTVRSMLLDANSFGKISAAENGAVFLDSKTRLAYDDKGNVTNVDIYGTSVSDYTNYGPKNEVYLGQGQGIAFKIENAAQLADIQLGIKQAGRDSGEVIINGHTIKVTSATDMYYSIKQYMTEDATVVVVNPGSSVISLTVLKTTKNDAQLQTAIIVTPELGKLAAERMMSYVNTPTEPMPIEPTVEPTVEPTEEPQPSKDPTPSEDPEPSVEPTEEPQPSEDPQPDDGDQDQDNALMNILKKIGDFFKKLFGGWKK